MSDARLPINHGDTGKVSRDKINDSFNDLVTTVEGYRPHIEAGVWWIGNTNTGVQAEGYETEFRVQDGYIQYKSDKTNVWNDLIAIDDLKGDQGEPGEAATITVGTTTTGAAGTSATVTNSGTSSAAVLNFTIPRGATGCKGDDGASICAAAFNGNDIDFTDTAGCVTTLCNAKTCLKGEPGQPGEDGAPGQDGEPGEAGASVCAAAFSGNDMVFTRTDSCTFTIVDAKNCLKGDQGAPGEDGEPGPAGNGICCVTATKNGKTTTVCMEYTNLAPTVFCVQDGADGQGSGDMSASTYDPNSCMADAFNYCNFYNTPTIPTDNCQLANGCGYTTCTGTLVASDLTPYAKTANLCAVATSAKYCDLTGQPAIPTDNCQLGNSCGFTTCTGTLVASDLNGYATTASLCTVATSGKYCDLTGTPALCTVATSGKYCDLSGTPAIPTDNCQLANGCGYTTCTGTISNCAGVISALGYTPYSSENPSGYTTCTGTLTQSAIDDTAFGASWDSDTTHAPSKNAVYDVLGNVETLLANL